jgi:hypothetical protein
MFSPPILDPTPQSPPTNHKAKPQATHTSGEVEVGRCKLMMIIVIYVMTKSYDLNEAFQHKGQFQQLKLTNYYDLLNRY